MKKITLFAIVLLLLSVSVSMAQSGDPVRAKYDSINQEAFKKMKYATSYEEALKRAKKEKKPIFFNCFADWALPCHGMNAQVFNDDEFAAYMDKHFVNLFVEMVETPEGKALSEQYKVSTFAQYLVLDQNGEVLLRIVGGEKLPGFQEEISMALDAKTTMPGMKKRYENGERNVKFLRDYANMLKSAGMEQEYDTVKNEFFSQIDKKDLCKSENWYIVLREARELDDQMFQFIVKNKADFIKYNGEKSVNGKISNAYTLAVYPYASGSKTFDAGDFNKIVQQFPSLDLPKDEQLFVVADIARYRGEKQYDKMIDVLEKEYTRLDEQVLPALNLSLSRIRNYSPAQKERVAAYLNDQMKKDVGNAKHYRRAVDELLNFAGILFEEGSFSDILAKAKEQNKPIFMDCYTSWCGPCRTMSENVFVVKKVGDIFNKEFINAKIDMEKGEGVGLAKKYNISSYPTMLVLDSDGVLVHRVVGASDVDAFIERMLRGLNSKTAYTAVKTAYEAGDRSLELMPGYFRTMLDAGELPGGVKEIENYLAGLTLEQRSRKAQWELFVEHVQDPNNPLFVEFLNNRAVFEKSLGKEEVYKKLERVYFPVLLGYFQQSLSKENLEKVRADLKRADLPSNSTLDYLQRLIVFSGQRNYDAILTLFENDIVNCENARDRLNLDVLLPKLVAGASLEQKQKALAYAKKSLESADPRAANGYRRLVEALNVD